MLLFLFEQTKASTLYTTDIRLLKDQVYFVKKKKSEQTNYRGGRVTLLAAGLILSAESQICTKTVQNYMSKFRVDSLFSAVFPDVL